MKAVYSVLQHFWNECFKHYTSCRFIAYVSKQAWSYQNCWLCQFRLFFCLYYSDLLIIRPSVFPPWKCAAQKSDVISSVGLESKRVRQEDSVLGLGQLVVKHSRTAAKAASLDCKSVPRHPTAKTWPTHSGTLGRILLQSTLYCYLELSKSYHDLPLTQTAALMLDNNNITFFS